MIDFPLYRITDEHNNEILTEDPEEVKELVLEFLEDNDVIDVRVEDNERI